MENPRFGIVVPTLNSAATLEWTLCALRGQRDITPEIIVADSGSADGTLDICKKWGVPPSTSRLEICTELSTKGFVGWT